MNHLFKIFFIAYALLVGPDCLHGQNLHFTFPTLLLPKATTDKAIDITNLHGSFFVTWKSPGNNADIHYCYLGKKYDTTANHHELIIPGEKTNFSPVLRVSNDRIYLFWIAADGALKYVLNQDDTSFAIAEIHSLSFTGNEKLTGGITSAAVGSSIVFASHAADKRSLVYAVVNPSPNGTLPAVDLKKITGNGSTNYPFVVALGDATARFCWRDYKDQGIYYADLDIQKDISAAPIKLGRSQTKTSPALYKVWNSTKLFYIWEGAEKDNKLYYTTDSSVSGPHNENALPGYFKTTSPVSICYVDNNNFLLAYTGTDNHIYVSKFANYNPSTWMQDILMPTKGNYTLKDIVIPGAHDAGMSLLNGVGGTQSGTINECNTLTQKKRIADQLKAGIRMFDLRVGTHNKKLYTKHCSSDCMADAIGGGYGEKLDTILYSIRKFLKKNRGEIVLLTFSHFCERETPVDTLATKVLNGLGKDIVYANTGGGLYTTPLKTLAGKVIVTFEHYSRPDHTVDSCTIADKSGAFINFRREYAATNEVDRFLSKEEQFFHDLAGGVNENDLIRLDWQLTQSSDEAAMICNDFQNENTNPLVDGVMVLTNALRKHRSIIDLSLTGNRYLPVTVNDWINKAVINPKNKPNILYVDVAGAWITDYCVELNQTTLYDK